MPYKNVPGPGALPPARKDKPLNPPTKRSRSPTPPPLEESKWDSLQDAAGDNEDIRSLCNKIKQLNLTDEEAEKKLGWRKGDIQNLREFMYAACKLNFNENAPLEELLTVDEARKLLVEDKGRWAFLYEEDK